MDTRVRLRGVDTPEIRRPECEAERQMGYEASAFTRAWLSVPASAESPSGPDAFQVRQFVTVSLHDIDLGSFAGRVVARIERSDGADLSADLLSAGLATRYRAPSPWCAGADAGAVGIEPAVSPARP